SASGTAQPESPSSSAAPNASSSSSSVSQSPEFPALYFDEQEIAVLDALLANWAAVSEEEEENGHNVAVYFKDLDSGVEYIYNGEREFFIASLNKAPYAMYLYHLVETGKTSLADTYYVSKEALASSAENSGKIKDDPDLPRNFTLEELIFYLLRYSDTGALRILLKHFPADGYLEYSKTFGMHHPDEIGNLINGRICALDAGIYLKNMFQYLENGVYGEEFKEHLLNTRYPMIRSEYEVVRKYGWDKNAYHDMAIVYAPHPYLLAILTDKSAGTAAELSMFSTIAKTLETMMENKWEKVEEKESLSDFTP
ncbi:MAG: serine hydrolase, partial [Oscillospiraceae bacterium]